MGGRDWNEAQLASEAHVEALAHVLHSMVDVVAQIINKVILRDELDKDCVSLPRVKAKLKEKDGTQNILSAINKLQNSAEFRYINAFVNTIKHQRILNRVWHAEYGKGKRNQRAVCFKKFEYKGKSYDFTWATDIIEPYRKRIYGYIVKIGNAVNEYLIST